MRITKFVIILLCTLFFTYAYSAEPIKLPSNPAPSPDGKLLAFCYEGDISTVPIDGGKAMRTGLLRKPRGLPAMKLMSTNPSGLLMDGISPFPQIGMVMMTSSSLIWREVPCL